MNKMPVLVNHNYTKSQKYDIKMDVMKNQKSKIGMQNYNYDTHLNYDLKVVVMK